MIQNINLPLVKGARGMSRPYGITCPKEHPPAPFARGKLLVCDYTPMHEVTPKVVAMAVSTVMTMFRIFCQRDLFMFDV